jgi:AcrR family transcriptional regulator
VSDRAEKTREALLEVAERRFAEAGYDGVSVRELARSAGCNLAAIQYHFGSKRELYLESVRRAMERRGREDAWAWLAQPAPSRRSAAVLLLRFVESFLERVCEQGQDNACMRLMLQEAMRPSEAIDAVVERFTRPHQELLVGSLARIAPALGARALELSAHSLLGQLLHYPIQRAFLERQSSLDLGRTSTRREIAEHLVRLTLRGLGCTEAFAAAVLTETSRKSRPKSALRIPRRGA